MILGKLIRKWYSGGKDRERQKKRGKGDGMNPSTANSAYFTV